MEYIDGEDLASLLRRIGRLPADKAAEFGRKICAGLAAAHARGILHRDLKPGNIMIDGRGEVRITDFGLATVAEQLQGPEVRHGTPAYMAPEQLAGREVTMQSDIYALGLVLYEMFTGKRAHPAESPAELLRMREKSQLTSPSSVITDLDPAAERAIVRCLQPDPRQRPASALELARALPGGDPLAAALAAGETPSPEMVASSGSTDALRPAIAITLLAVFAVCLAIICVMNPRITLVGHLPLDYPPEVLEVKAREIAASLGYPDRPVDSAWGFRNDLGYVTYLQKSVSNDEGWRKTFAIAPSPITYWYRQGPAPIVPVVLDGTVTPASPVPSQPGMVGISLDMDGRLRQFNAVPPQHVDNASNAPPGATDWTPLFAAARLNMSAFQPSEPQWTPLAATDTRAAWTGTYLRPSLSGIPIRVEAAAFRGKPVYFLIVWPWTTPTREPAARSTAGAVEGFVVCVLLVAVIVMFRYNWKAGRGDVRGATHVAVFAGLSFLSSNVLRAHHVGSQAEYDVIIGMIQNAATASMVTWIFYLVLEPWVRRYWPQSLIVWSRVLGNRWKDPVVGRDVLIGIAGATLISLGGAFFIQVLLSAGSAAPMNYDLMNVRLNVAGIAFAGGKAVIDGLTVFLVLFFARALLRNQWLAALVPAGLLAAIFARGEPQPAIIFVFFFVFIGAVSVALMRLGLLVGVAAFFTMHVILECMPTYNFTAWYGQGSFLAVAVLVALAVWAFRTSLGGQKLFSSPQG
jgi:serine/threonine-protein kinase